MNRWLRRGYSLNVGVLVALVGIGLGMEFSKDSLCKKHCVKSIDLSLACSTHLTWWLHQMETFSALLAICAGNSPVTGEFLAQRPVTRSVDVFFDLRVNQRLSKQSWGWYFETLSCPLWRHRNGYFYNFSIPGRRRGVLDTHMMVMTPPLPPIHSHTRV